MSGKASIRALILAVAAAVTLVLAAPPAPAADGPSVELSRTEAGKGGTITVTGKGWRPKTLLMMLICGRAAPDKDPIGGTNACANSDGRAVTTDGDGGFSKRLPVAEPPEACPCVVRVATVTGEKATAQAAFEVAGHPVKPLPKQPSGGKLAVLAATRLEGSSSVLTWFGAPPGRELVVTVGNLGSAPVKDPVFKVGTSHGVLAPEWEEQQWRGTIAPGKKAQVKLKVQLDSGAHGDYLVSLQYGGKVLAEQPWGVGRPWGVTLFWILLCVVVPAAVFRIGMAIVDRVRPRRRSGGHHARRVREVRGLRFPKALTPLSGTASRAAEKRRRPDGPGGTASDPATTASLPWFTPDSAPGAPTQLSAPQENRPTAPGKGNT
ncbi:neocarzinostatin apoprotein domain-containing protein [Streptomyces monticola]|uniref:Neocarzinostatin apoprotein domain-containing protein n=1 Tax=Streptomyces monticola TaxID=2666263 RepID=A0ABW2JWK2_9ACTN